MRTVLRLAAFELRYQLRRVATWVYVVVFALIAFLVVASQGGAFGNDAGDALTIINSPYRVFQILQIISIVGVPVTAAFAGNAVYRDFQTGAYPLFFTTPIRPTQYLAGRWVGAVAANTLPFVGAVAGILIACAWPTVHADRVGPVHLLDYLSPLGLIVVPNLLFTAALFVVLTALTRRMLPSYVGGVALLVGWGVARVFSMALEVDRATRLLDPFAIVPVNLSTRYFTVYQQDFAPIPVDDALLLNRALWIGVGVAAFVLGALLFRFRHSADDRAGVRRWKPAPAERAPGPLVVPAARRSFGFGARLLQLAAETRRAVREVVANVWFPVLLSLALLMVAVVSNDIGEIYGTRTFPVTYEVLELLTGAFGLMVVIFITFYSGELVWNERESRAAGIHDALPVPNWVPFLSRLCALLLIVLIVQAAAMAAGMTVQAAHGWTRFEIGVYLRELFVFQVFGGYLPILVLALLVQTLVNHKYVGYLAVILAYVGQGLVYWLAGIKHNLLMYGGTPNLEYSELNGFGHAVTAFAWFALYWTLVGAILLLVADLFWQRGQETSVRWRLRLAGRRFRGPMVATAAALVAMVLATGGWIFYNTNVLNRYEPQRTGQRIQADYEKLYKRWEWAPQPRVTGAVLQVDIHPDTRDLELAGTYTLTNRSGVPVDSLDVDVVNSLKLRRLSPDRPATRVVSDSLRGFYVFRLARPLAPGDSMHLAFSLAHVVRGFENEPSYAPVINNGTFFDNHWLPHVGYNADGELTDPGDREKFGLPPRPRTARIDAPRARTRNFVSSDADWMAFDVTLSTSLDQTAVAPGYLQRTWTAGGRRFFHYRMDAPILDFYAFQSARYTVRRDAWKGVAIEVYYDRKHAYNVGRMIDGVKASLDYCTREFGPYQHRQVRILEFPRYGSYAQSFDNTIPYSEGIGFIADVRHDDIDYPFFVTAHEVAHQWWGHQEAPADVQGSAMLSETLAEYTALMVMEKRYGRAKIGRFLRFELDQYLRGRGGERRAERPLMLVENQQYIHYNKGALAMYALRDWIGERAVNDALREFLDTWRFRGPPYPTSDDLVRRLRDAAPDSLKPAVDDLFRRVTLWDNAAVSATARRVSVPGDSLDEEQYEVTLTVRANKSYADSLGDERAAPLDDWVDLGVYSGNVLAYLYKEHITRPKETFTLTVYAQPDSAGIDPQHKLIDRDLEDNVRVVRWPAAPRARAPVRPRRR